ncbi:diguanylate cyclase [Quadrisphaera sp. KR29]|uniref:diguanylate cyclase n=1 Tax=Quadrisphaera sp. KR29 TaxID=3461391 RepID=UPI00404485C8
MAAGALVAHGLPGVFHDLVDEVADQFDACDYSGCAARCQEVLPWLEALGDTASARYVRYVGAMAWVEVAELERAADLLEDLLGVPSAQDPLWRAKALALSARVAFTAGRHARAVEHLAEALDLLDRTPSRHLNRLSATMAAGLALQAAGAHPEGEALLRAVLAEVPATPGVHELNVLPELVLLVAERAASADLSGDGARADRHWQRVLALALRWRRSGLAAGDPLHVLRSAAAEALAWQRLGDPVTAVAVARGVRLEDAATTGVLTGRVEAVMARLHLAQEAERGGDLQRAGDHLDDALVQTHRTEPGVWAFTALAARAELDARVRDADEGADPARRPGERPDRWRDLARTLLARTAASSRSLVSEVEATRQAHRVARAHDAAARAVRTDPLTGVANRRGLDDALAEAAREGTGVSACFVDVDRFKAVNDGFSHEVGDEVLRRVAALLVEVTRSQPPGAGASDLVARYGGDEFVVLGRRGGDLAAVGRRVVEAVGAHPWDAVAPGLAITVSVGVTRPQPAASVLAAADAAMLGAKRSGRGRAVVSAP